MINGGNSDNKRARHQAAKEAAKDGRGPLHYESYHYHDDGQWVASDIRDGNNHRRLNENDTELKEAWEYYFRGEKIRGGFRPSKRKAVK